MDKLLLNQLYTIFIFMLYGISIGIIFDFFRAQRKVIKTNDIITYIQDILFCLISGSGLFFIIFKFTNGEIRMYMIFGGMLGIIMYFNVLSQSFIKFFRKAI